jgi:hypothetical protein
MVPNPITLPGGLQFPYHGAVRGTSSGYVGYTAGEGGRWQSFHAVHWHGGVDVFLGNQGGRAWEHPGVPRMRVVYLLKCADWAWAAFDLQRRMVERFGIAGPFRAILGVTDTAGAFLATLGAGWLEPGAASLLGQPTAIEPRVLLLEDLGKWPDEKGPRNWRFGSAPGWTWRSAAPGERHLDRTGPEQGRFNPRW